MIKIFRCVLLQKVAFDSVCCDSFRTWRRRRLANVIKARRKKWHKTWKKLLKDLCLSLSSGCLGLASVVVAVQKKSGNLFTVVTPNRSKRVAQSSLIRCHVDVIKRNCQGASLEREERTLIQSKAQPVFYAIKSGRSNVTMLNIHLLFWAIMAATVVAGWATRELPTHRTPALHRLHFADKLTPTWSHWNLLTVTGIVTSRRASTPSK